jgi:L-amino acid N-acyltransferase YncA
MDIRLAQRDDVPAILDISNWAAMNTPANFAVEPEVIESWFESFDKTQSQYPWLVAQQNNQRGERDGILGFAKASPHRGRCAYAWTAEVSVYVHPKHHGKGIGSALYRRLIPILKAQGYVTLIAGITTPNPASEKLHQAFGFRRLGAFERVGWKFNRWHDVSYWQTLLDDSSSPPGRIKPVSECHQHL